MDGRFQKIDVTETVFTGRGGLYCNNENRDLVYHIMKEKFGKPNGNALRDEESTWKYILEFQGIYLAIYDYNGFWSLGFLELQNLVPDYELIYALSSMLFNYLNQQIESYSETTKIKVA